MDSSARLPSCSDFVRSLEEERKKIQVFERELPLCLQIVTHAIESLRHEIESDAASDDGPVLEEFIPLRPSSSCSSEGRRDDGAAPIQSDEKPDWLSTVQLWNHVDADVNPAAKVEAPARPVAVRAKRTGDAFRPFEGERHAAVPPPPAACCLTTSGGVDVGGGAEEKEGQSQPTNRKLRRCWSPELHSRFLQALEQLGGSSAATPKQIRQVMKVDGLTNDEIKSHLQKYRLHSRRPGTAVHTSAVDGLTLAPQFVVVGGIWVPPVDYSAEVAAAAAAAAAATGKAAPLIGGTFTPAASLPSDWPGFQRQQPQSKLKQSHSSPTGRCSRENYSSSSSYSQTIN